MKIRECRIRIDNVNTPSYQQILEQELFPALRKGAVAVTSTVRLARRLRFRYGRWRRASNATVWRRPQVLSWQEWMRRLWEDSLLRGGRAGEFPLLSEQGSLVLWERAVGQTPAEGPHLDQQAELARRSWNLALRYGLDPEPLRAEAQGEDEERFAGWVGAFEEARRDGGWLEPDALPMILADDAQSGALRLAGPLVFLGMEEAWTPPGKALVQALKGAGLVVLPAPEPPPAVRVRQTAFESSADELQAAARWAGSANAGVVLLDFSQRAGQARRILLDQMQPCWQTRGFPLAPPLNSAEAPGLAQAGPPEMALAVLHLLPRQFQFERLSRVLRGAYLHGSREESGPRAQLERKLRERLVGARLSRSQLIRFAHSSTLALTERLEEGWRLARAARGRGKRPPHRVWGAVFTAFLDALGWPGNRPLESDEQQSLQAWRSLLSDFGGCDAVSSRPVSLTVALDRLEAMARRRRFQPQGPDEAVELLPIEEVAGMHFDRLWVAGAGADLWPRRRVNPAPLLPLRLQRRVGIPNASPQASLEQARRQTKALLGAGGEVVFSWTRVAEEGVGTTLSPLVAALDPEERQTEPPAARSYLETLQASAELERLAGDDAPRIEEDEEVTGGTHLMDHQLNCPFRAFVEFRLHAQEYPQPWDGLHPIARGNLLHALLQRLYTECGDGEALQGAIADLPGRLADWARELPERPPLGQRALAQGLLQLERARAVNLALQLSERDSERPFRVESLEEATALELLPIELSMRLDRVESLGEKGGCLVLDYKTGSKTPLVHLDPRNLRSSQLPAYALATEGAAAVGYVYLNEEGVEFRGLLDPELELADDEKVAGINPTSSAASRDFKAFETWQDLLDAWRRALERAARQLAAGDAQVQMHSQDTRARGQYQVLSRIHELAQAERESTRSEPTRGEHGSARSAPAEVES